MEDDIFVHWANESDFEYDYMMGGWAIPTPLHTFKDNKVQYNQRIHDPYWCTWYWAMTCIANNWGIQWTDADFLYMRIHAPDYWRVNEEWMYLSKAGDMVVDYLNKKFPEQWWKKLAINTIDEWKWYMDMWYMIHIGSKINKWYTGDIQDWLISAPRWQVGMWHARSCTDQSYWNSIVENYVWWLPHNVIDVWSRDELMKAKQLYTQSFIYYPTHTMPVEIPYPYATVERADNIEKLHPDMFTPWFSETVRAWIDMAKEWKIQYAYKNYLWVDWVMKMTNDLDYIRRK